MYMFCFLLSSSLCACGLADVSCQCAECAFDVESVECHAAGLQSQSTSQTTLQVTICISADNPQGIETLTAGMSHLADFFSK